MVIVGLTGGIASGKSTVAAMFEKRGAHIIDFDVLARVVVEPDKPAWQDIVDFFGPSILNKDRTIDRARLGGIVFADETKRKTLEGFIHPRISGEYARRIGEINEKDPEAIVLVDVPLLIETGMEGLFEKIIVVYSTPEQQMERLINRDGLAREEAIKRLEAQMPIDEKRKRADYVVNNSGSLEEVEREVDTIFASLRSLWGSGNETAS